MKVGVIRTTIYSYVRGSSYSAAVHTVLICYTITTLTMTEKQAPTDNGSELLVERIKQLENDLESTHVHAMHLLQSNSKMHAQASIYVQEIHSRDMKIENLKELVHWYEVELAKVRAGADSRA